jgi:hypothetical protein
MRTINLIISLSIASMLAPVFGETNHIHVLSETPPYKAVPEASTRGPSIPEFYEVFQDTSKTAIKIETNTQKHSGGKNYARKK